jgi:hypothetical protein
MPNSFGLKLRGLHARPEKRGGRDRLSDDSFALDVTDDVCKDVSQGKERKARNEPLKMRVSFILQTLSNVRHFCPNSRNTRRSLLVRT